MSPQQRQKRLDRAQLHILFNLPFFAPGVMQLPVVWDETVPTAQTNGKVIKWNPDWFDKLSPEHLPTVLCHEVMHLLYGHLWRAPVGADHETWNIACDHAVNLQLEEFGSQVKARGLADPFPFPQGAFCKDASFAGMAEEAIYSRIYRPNPPGGGSGGQPGKGGGGQSKRQPVRQPFGEFEVQNPAQPGAKQAREKWEATLIQSCTIAKGRGKLPAGMARLVKDLIDPEVPWYILLRQWLREQASDDWNWQKPNLYYSGEFILPVLESERVGAVVFATDTSGSIDQDALAHFQSEKQSCLDELAPSRLVDIQCDAKIHEVREYRIGDTIARECKGGGGTNFRPVFEHCASLNPAPKCLVYLTDLYGTFPDEAPEYPVLWVTWNDEDAPFGTTVHVRRAS